VSMFESLISLRTLCIITLDSYTKFVIVYLSNIYGMSAFLSVQNSTQ